MIAALLASLLQAWATLVILAVGLSPLLFLGYVCLLALRDGAGAKELA